MVSKIITKSMLFENLPLLLAFTFLLFSSGGAVKLIRCKDNERRALLDLKKEFVDDESGLLLSSWGSQEEDCCKWRGIRCSNTTGHVILLDLHGWYDRATFSRFYLSGKVSPSLLELNQLKYLDLSYNYFNSSPIPEFIGSLSKLQHLNLSWSDFVGRVPHQLGNLTNLRSLDLGFNSGFLTVENLEWLSDLRLLRHLDLTDIDLQKVDLLQSIDRLSFLSSLHLRYCNLPGIISPSLHLTNFSSIPLSIIDLSSNRFTNSLSYNWLFNFSSSLIEIDMSFNPLGGSIPDAFGNMMSLESLSLSECSLKGEIPKSFKNLSRIRSLDLHSNNLTGQLPNLTPFPRNLSSLNLSKNMFSGSIVSLCTIVTEFLGFLDLSDNLLSGEIPDCWIDGNNLEILNLANNNLSWKIPASFGFLHQLKLLSLRNNSLIGELPSSLKNCSSLTLIDMSENKLSGQLPAWIGTDLKLLAVLSFRRNEFHGSIPCSMCLLNHSHVFDLSQNKISGNIPRCFNRLYSLIQTESLSMTMSIQFPPYYYDNRYYMPSVLVQWKGKMYELKNKRILGEMKCIDLSSNKLVGQIPQELASLEGLISLNLSRNNLTGPAIQKINQMKELESLDLSRNQLSGAIPIGLGSLIFLSFLDLSSNNFSGKIPQCTQLNFMSASAFAGNDKLCGLPLSLCPGDKSTLCPGDKSTLIPPFTDHGKGYTDEKDEDMFVTIRFCASVVLGYTIGFWGFIGPLILRSSWRYAYFKLLDKIQDWIYVTIAVNTARVQRKFRG